MNKNLLDVHKRRLFIAWECKLFRTKPFPKGRSVNSPHITVAFLGNIETSDALLSLRDIPIYPSFISPVGICSKIDFLPKQMPRVAALVVEDFAIEFYIYQKEIIKWLASLGYLIRENAFLPHITLVRAPFEKNEWMDWFQPGPVILHSIHLYESIGNLSYEKIATLPMLPGIEEIEHTADLAFIIRGENLLELFHNAKMALALECPSLLPFMIEETPIDFVEMIRMLNRIITVADEEIGAPYKAVSYHGQIKENQKYLEWEMIIDV